MPNWDRYCTNCGFLGSYLDFYPTDVIDPEDQECSHKDGCGETVRWEELDQDKAD